MHRNRIQLIFYSLMLSIYAAVLASFGIFVVRWDHLASVFLFAVLSILFFLGSYNLARELMSLFLKPRPMPSLQSAPQGLRVALLYATMNDVVPECIMSLKQDYPCDVYILDDSTDTECRELIDRIAQRRGYTVMRRGSRAGYKAGAINDWLAAHSGRYDYMVLLDADSYLPPDWVRETLRYAEHPENSRVAIFQGQINIWNLDTAFVRAFAPFSRVGQFVWERGLANELDAVFCYGHNVMLRISAVCEIGGMVEGYVSEDFATAVALADRGWKSRFVPLHTYEAMPENVRGFIRRQNKWTRGAMEFFGFCARSRIDKGKKLHLIHIPLNHVAAILLPAAMLLTVYGFSSTYPAALAFLAHLASNPLLTIWSNPLLRFVLLYSVIASLPGMLIKQLCRISLRTSMTHRILSSAISSISMPYELRSMLSYLFTGIRSIPVTPKGEKPLSVLEIVHISMPSLVIQAVLWTGIAAVNIMGALFNATWLIPMALSPLVIYHFGSGSTGGNGGSASETSCLMPDPQAVNAALSSLRHAADV